MHTNDHHRPAILTLIFQPETYFCFKAANAVNKLLFANTLFRDLPDIIWLAMTIFRDHALSTLVLIYHPYGKD